MWDRLHSLLGGTARPSDPGSGPESEIQVAVAALLAHLVMADGVAEPVERATLEQLLQERFGLDRESARALILEGRAREQEAVDFYAFTSALKRRLDEAGRRDVVEMMWELVYAVGWVHELEDNVVWRVAELLGVSARDRNVIRHRVASRIRPLTAGASE
jgi:uncharacterized tellurite resistance protein B-like protein